MTLQGIPLWNELKPKPTRPVFILPLDFDNWASSVGVVPLCLPYQRQPHAHPCVLSPPFRNTRIMSPFRESVGCQHVNISEMASIKYQALLRGCWQECCLMKRVTERDRVIHRRGMMCFLPSRQICQVKDSTLLRRRICGLLKCIKTCSSPFYVVFFLTPSLSSSKSSSYFVVQFIELAKPVHTNTHTGIAYT